MQITICDICGTSKNVRKVWLPYDRQATAAGSCEDVGKTYDLCCECYLKVLKNVIKKKIKARKLDEFSFNANLIDVIEEKKKESSNNRKC